MLVLLLASANQSLPCISVARTQVRRDFAAIKGHKAFRESRDSLALKVMLVTLASPGTKVMKEFKVTKVRKE